MGALKYESMTPLQKAAVALVAFGPEVSAHVLKGMPEADLEKITIEIANLREVPPDVEDKVIDECYQIFMARQYISQGGIDFARKILESAVGVAKAREIMQRLLNGYEAGISVSIINFQDVTVPEQVKDAFDDAIKAREDEQRVINDARAYAADVVPKASGRKARVLAEANGF
ncbi:MAG TPA: hypothetical protein PKY95_00810, partial [candidate division Zixibacteria bacterium]|nr:hypothetical protein [candidate division Zixibacteria bacterium]